MPVRARTLLILTGLVSSILGAVVVYLVMTVPNDLRAGVLLKQARADIAAGDTAQAQDALARVIQQYPRTDAAAAATVALMRLEGQERQEMQAEIGQLRAGHAEQTKAISELQRGVETIRKTPPPAPAPPATVTAPEPAKAAPAKVTAKKPPAKKTSTKKKPTTRRKKR